MSKNTDAYRRSGATDVNTACVGKVAFDNRSQAVGVVNRRQTKERPGRSAYKCGHCHKWHIGSDHGRVEITKKHEFKERKSHE